MYNHRLAIGPFSFSLSTNIRSVSQQIEQLYAHHLCHPCPSYVDFNVRVKTPLSHRRWFRPQVEFFMDEINPFKPLPRDQAYPMLEWGMNWCIANHAHHYLIEHAGVIEKNGRVIMMPATQGSGKSTLTAAMMLSGWRLFSDELALLSLQGNEVIPLARPINIKNDAIDILQSHFSQAEFGDIAHDTLKGTVALMKPGQESVANMHQKAPLHCIVFPTYKAGSEARLSPLSSLDSFQRLIDNSFNYNVLGAEGFHKVADILQSVPSYEFEYSRFEDASDTLDKLVEDA
ncbi:HprK-related kinase A [Lacimicrobium alkaliphilum]|uniref:HPr kinase n=1 Tax=Lacimicrobium alkaliphilum TaxID=1526571 RepID=A0ABQ1RPE8_9ALTE|nr:HprK-related kinase A [Lacimicrobium alkaliphilum]GGD75082.1 HPr kinase [Lacimicrobium alkaliphilum]